MPLPKIPQDLDRRRKLTDEDRDRIRALYRARVPIRAIAREFAHVSRRLIQFVLFPDRLDAVNLPGHWKKYYDKEKRRIAMRKHRARRRSLGLPNK